MYTIESVKQDLPDINVKSWDAAKDAVYKIVKGRVTGRLCKFATVTPFVVNNGKTKYFNSFEVSWNTIVHVLNHNKVLC